MLRIKILRTSKFLQPVAVPLLQRIRSGWKGLSPRSKDERLWTLDIKPRALQGRDEGSVMSHKSKMQAYTLEELIEKLPGNLKAQVYDFASYLLERSLREEDRKWALFSLREAVRGLEEEPLYTEADLKERWR